jgi:two-component system chemotaxis sensor kinase CheA
VAGLARLANLNRPSNRLTPENEAAQIQQLPTQMLLLFRAGSFNRIAIPLSLVARLEEIPANRIERAGGSVVLHYRGEILSLVHLASVLEPGRVSVDFSSDVVQVIVFTDGTRQIGVVVDEIVDIVDEAMTVRRGSTAIGLLGSAVIGGKITDLLDLHAVVGAAGENWLNSPEDSGKGSRILLVDSCLPAREMISEYLGAAGYEMVSAATVADALGKLRGGPVDLVIAAVEATRGEGSELLKAMRKDRQFEHIPVLGLVEHEHQLHRKVPDGLTYDARLVRSHRDSLLGCVGGLVRKEQDRLEAVA